VKIGELDHADILIVPVSRAGVRIDEVGRSPHDNRWQPAIAFAVMGFAGWLVTRLLSVIRHLGRN
jgi:hypothetical protein